MDNAFNAAETALQHQAAAARAASRALARLPAAARDAGLRQAAASLRDHAAAIQQANDKDLASYQGTPAFRDRLTLNAARIEAMATALNDIAGLPDPLAGRGEEWTRPNGLRIRRVSSPIGVIGMIYESRPNVGADAAGICIKSGNAVILRGGSESFHSAGAINAAITEGLAAAGLPGEAAQSAPTTDRAFVAAMLGAAGLIDLIIPRGGKSLVLRVQQEARVPVLAHAEGICHTYIHAAANPDMARAVLHNAKLRRTGICGATETLLIDAAAAPALLPMLVADLADAGCSFRADARARAIVPTLPAAAPQDFGTEWLDAILSIAVVDGVDSAIAHIERHGSSHTEAIVTDDAATAEYFLSRTDSAVTMWNTSTQFCDGAEFGFGAEIGIATGRIHARGPVGPEQLTTFRYQVRGTGQIRK
ncbi:MAG: glutamate-5-semialdehyde dehydrogenase [Rhodospirillales bacterium]